MVLRLIFASVCVFAISSVTAAANGFVKLTITDRLGRSLPDVFALVDAAGKSTPAAGRRGDPVSVAAGAWRIIPDADSRLARNIVVSDGQTITVNIESRDGIWLSIRTGFAPEPQWIFVVPKDAASAVEALAAFDLSRRSNGPLAVRLPEASRDDVAAALSLARATYGRPLEDRTEAGALKRLHAHVWAGRIIAAIGDQADVDRLTAPAPLYDNSDDLMIAARIEQRLGTIDGGRVAALARGKSERAGLAAVYLHQAGVAAADELITTALLRQEKPEPLEVWLAAVPIRSPAADQAFAAEIEHLVARSAQIDALPEKDRKKEFNQHAVVVLPLIMRAIIRADDAQLRKLTPYPISSFDLPLLGLEVANPEALAKLLMGWSEGSSPRDFIALNEVAALCPLAETLKGTGADAVWKRLSAVVRQAGERQSRLRTNLAPAVARALPDNFVDYLSTAFSPCRPAPLVTVRLVEKQWDLLPLASWIPRPDLVDQLAGYLAKPKWSEDFNWDQVDMVLEAVPLAALETALRAKAAGKPAYPIDVYLAYRRVATRANYAFPSSIEYGLLSGMRKGLVERPYVFGSKEFEGGVSGVLKVRVEEHGKTNQIRLRLDQRAYYGSAGFIEFRKNRSEWKFYPYTVDHGRKLIAAVTLFKGATAVPLQDTTIESNGDIIYETPPMTGWAGTLLEIDLAMFEDKRRLLFDLASDLPSR